MHIYIQLVTLIAYCPSLQVNTYYYYYYYYYYVSYDLAELHSPVCDLKVHV